MRSRASSLGWLLTLAIVSSTIAVFHSPRCAQAATSANIGINYGQVANNLPSPQRVVQLIRSTTIRKVKLYDANPLVLSAFAGSSVEFIVTVKNEDITSLLDYQVALKWASENVALYMQSSPIKIISVGNQVLTEANVSSSVHTQLVTVMTNLHTALDDLKLSHRVFVSTSHSMAILGKSFPPSAGEFKDSITKPVMLPLLRFLNQTGAPFMVNIYPYFSYKAKPLDISLAYALFLTNNGVTDSKSKLHYDNLFDAQVDAVYSAMSKLGFTNIPVLVSETGWPSNGSPIELAASVSNAMTYNRNLVKHIQSGAGTPMRPKQELQVFIFALFNENQKPGPTSQRNFGLFRPGDLSTVYDIGILQGHSTSPSGNPPPPLQIPIQRPPPSPFTIPIPRPPSPMTTRRPPPPPRPPPSPYRPVYPPPSRSPSPPPPHITKPPPSPPPLPTCPPSRPMPPPPSYSPPPVISRPPPHPPVVPWPPVYRPPPVYPPSPSYPPVYPSPMLPPPTPVYVPSPRPPYYYPPVNPAPVVMLPPPPSAPTTPSPGQGGGTHIWCVAKPGGDTATLMSALNYACGEGGADCSAIQPGGSCFQPNTVDAHASYAFNSYYQKHGRNYWNCYFDGNALVTVSDPSSGSCIYPSQ
ncbi:glucan endo-1,3-beta-glucosidase 11 [Selaginella moellendorffii]|nr:glucan endo-1,3-beta-glucosidase 11 [Selaginella moellendorffii]|eukprot:XP_002975447.2 glucan endo-1,3-beta-glucosidase 11 [Selaginella moellendorffii]